MQHTLDFNIENKRFKSSIWQIGRSVFQFKKQNDSTTIEVVFTPCGFGGKNRMALNVKKNCSGEVFLENFNCQESDATNKINSFLPQHSFPSVMFQTELMMEEFQHVGAEEYWISTSWKFWTVKTLMQGTQIDKSLVKKPLD